jgi:polyisoprenoid-binding protein YceI
MITVLPLLTSLTLLGCEDPAANAPKATVGSTQPSAAASAATKPATNAAATSWTIQNADSKLEFVGSKVTGKHDGGFKTFSGTAKLTGDKADGGSVTVEIDTSSIFTDDEKLTAHLSGPDFFDIAKHPKATFTSTEIKADGDKYTVTGNLDLHGKTKSISFPATIAISGDAVTVKSEFSINRKDFDIVYAGMPDDLIRDDVVIKLDLKLTKS